jgi:Subtilase family
MRDGSTSIARTARASSTRGTARLWAPAVGVACALMLAAGAAEALGAIPRQAWRGADMRKLDGRLQTVARAGLGSGGQARARIAARRADLTVSLQGAMSVDVYVFGDVARAADRLRGLGMRVSAVSWRAPTRAVEGYLPSAALLPAAALRSTRAIVPTLSQLSSGGTLSEGDAAVRGPQARVFGATGAGIVVGVISDSIDENPVGGLAASIASGDLPANTQVLADDPLGDRTDEGRAMAEVIYDEAPGISGIVFATGVGGPAAKVGAIDALVARGVRVIVDDASDTTEPAWQDGIVAQAVDRAKLAGVAYIAAAGNDAGHAWQAYYLRNPDAGAIGPYNDFNPHVVPATYDTTLTVGTVPPGRDVVVTLQWAQPWGGATTDFRLEFVQDAGGTLAFDAPDSDNLVTGLPQEYAVVHGGAGGGTFGIRIVVQAGNPYLGPLMKVMAYTKGAGVIDYEYAAYAPTIDGGAATARGALTVGASRYDTPTTPEPFSATGPVTRYFDASGVNFAPGEVRVKPELMAPDGVATTVAGLSPFTGTSASAASAAGTAALIRSANPALTVDTLYAIMKNPANALSCTTPGVPGVQCGAGFLLADRAVAMADPTLPVVTATVSPAKPDGANGWYRVPVVVTWSASDTSSPLTGSSGCGATRPAEGATTLTCSATSSAGTTSTPLTIKRDSTPPVKPVLTGIRAVTYSPAKLPRASAIRCRSTDRISGISRCTVTGYRSTPGRHTLTAVARNGAGRTATRALIYTVTRPPAISRLAITGRPTAAGLAKSGLALTLTAATSKTRLSVELLARTPSTPGRAASRRSLGRLSKTVAAGSVALRITLTAAARRVLLSQAGDTLEIVVSGTSARAKPASLQRTITFQDGSPGRITVLRVSRSQGERA